MAARIHLDQLVRCAPVERAARQMQARRVDLCLELLDQVGHHESVRYARTLRGLVPRIRASGA